MTASVRRGTSEWPPPLASSAICCDQPPERHAAKLNGRNTIFKVDNPTSIRSFLKRRAWDSNPQPLAGHHNSNVAACQFAYPPTRRRHTPQLNHGVIAVDRTILTHPKNATSRPDVAGLPVQTAEMVCPKPCGDWSHLSFLSNPARGISEKSRRVALRLTG